MSAATLDPILIDQAAPHRIARRSIAVEVLLFVMLIGAVCGRVVPTCSWLAAIYLLTIPGDQLRRTLGVDVTSFGRRVLFGVAGSVAMLIVDCVLIQAIGLVIGEPQPFHGSAVVVGVLLVNCGTLCLAQREGASDGGPLAPLIPSAAVLAGMVPPIAVVLGSALLDTGHGPWLLIVGFAVAATLLLLGEMMKAEGDAVTLLALYSLSLSILWSFTLRTPFLYGYDINQEYSSFVATTSAGFWRPQAGGAFNAMLSLTAIPTVLAQTTGISGTTLFKFLYPMLFAMLPVSAFLVCRRYVSRAPALVAVLVLCLNPAGFWQIAGVARQELALCCFAALLLLLVDAPPRPRARAAFAIILGLACVFTHYSTSYVAVAVLLPVALLQHFGRRRRKSTAERGKPSVGLVLPLVMLVASVSWNAGVNRAAQNLQSTSVSVVASGGGLAAQDNVIATWLKGTVSTEVAPSRFFELSAREAVARSWLKPYSSSVQANFPASPAQAARPEAVLPQLLSATDVALTGLRQAALLGILFGAAMLVRASRRSRLVVGTEQTVEREVVPDGARLPSTATAIALAAVLVAAAMRCSTALSLAYNSERLVSQLSVVLVLPLAIIMQWLLVRRSALLRLALTTVVLLAGLFAVVDATGLRGVLTGSSAGNLQNGGEHVERYRITQSDVAAADWLSNNFDRSNQVYADRYGALIFRSRPEFNKGLFDVLTPALLDQRGYVFGTSENVVGGRARGQINGRSSLYTFPTEFFDKYKARVYSNGSAAVWN